MELARHVAQGIRAIHKELPERGPRVKGEAMDESERRRLSNLAENDQLHAWTRELGADVMQPVEQVPGLPLWCGCRPCHRLATWVISRHLGSPRVYGFAACDSHVGTMGQAVVEEAASER